MAIIGIFVVFACTLYWLTLKSAQATLDDEFSHREQVVARVGSLSISGFINLLGKNVAFLAEDLSENTLPGEKENNVSNFMSHWKDTPVIAILLADKNGKVIVDANRFGSPEIGGSVTGKSFYSWAKTAKQGEFFVSPPITGTVGYARGKYIITVASPVMIDGKFNGVISTAVSLSGLTNNYINPLKFSENTRVYLADDEGVILSSLKSNLVGVNYIDYLSGQSYRSKEDAVKKLNSILTSTESESKFQIDLPDSLNSGAITNYIVAYSKVEVGSSKWFLVIASPEKDSGIYLWKIKEVNFCIFVFTLILVFLFAAAHLRADRLRAKERSLS